MSHDNVELVRRSFEAFARGDFDAAFAAYDPSIEWRTAADEPDQQTYSGLGGLRAFVDSLGDTWEGRFSGVMEFEDFIDRGGFVVVPWTARLRGRGSGIAMDVRETYVVRVEGGKIVRVEEYRSRDQALAALEEPDGPPPSRDNVDVVRAIIEAVPDWERVRSLLHPDAHLDQTRIPDGGVYEGREAFGRFFQRWFGTWDDLRLTPERFIEDGDRVLALMTIEGRGKGSGVPAVIRSADLWTVRDGKILSLVGYPDRAEALRVMGLSE